MYYVRWCCLQWPSVPQHVRSPLFTLDKILSDNSIRHVYYYYCICLFLSLEHTNNYIYMYGNVYAQTPVRGMFRALDPIWMRHRANTRNDWKFQWTRDPRSYYFQIKVFKELCSKQKKKKKMMETWISNIDEKVNWIRFVTWLANVKYPK